MHIKWQFPSKALSQHRVSLNELPLLLLRGGSQPGGDSMHDSLSELAEMSAEVASKLESTSPHGWRTLIHHLDVFYVCSSVLSSIQTLFSGVMLLKSLTSLPVWFLLGSDLFLFVWSHFKTLSNLVSWAVPTWSSLSCLLPTHLPQIYP